MGRKLICLLSTALCLCMVVPRQVFATAPETTIVRVGIFDYEAFYGTDAQGQPYGYGYEYLEEIAKHTGFRYEYVYGSWSECLSWLESGKIDLLDSAQKHAYRLEKFLFSEYSTGTSYGELFVRADNQTIHYNDFDSMNGIRVGMLEGNSRNETFLEHARQNNFSVTTRMFATETELAGALQSNAVDAIVSSNLRLGQNERTVARFAPTPFFMRFGKDNMQLKEKVDAALEAIQVGSPNFNAQLASKYYAHEDAPPSFTRQEQELVAGSTVYRVAYNKNWAPFSSFNTATHSPVGINIELLELIGKKTGLRFEYIPCASQSEAAQKVAAGEADLLLGLESAHANQTPPELQATNSFIDVPICLIGREAEVSDGMVFAVPENSRQMLWILQGQFPASAITVLDSSEACYRAVLSGQADYTLDNAYTATNVIRSGRGHGLMIAFVSPARDYYSIGLGKDTNPTLLRVLNKGIASVSQAEITTAFANHTVSASSGLTVSGLINRNPAVAFLLLVLLAALLVIAAVVVYRHRKLKKLHAWNNTYIDTLTGIGTLSLFEEELRAKLEQNSGVRYVVCKFDVENLKIFNDIYGFDAGDRVLQIIAEEVSALVVPELDVCARISGDNFIILKHYTRMESNRGLLRECEHRVRQAVNREFNYLLTLQFGIYYLQDNSESFSSILEKANYAHSICKVTPSINRHLYNDEDRLHAVEEKKIESRMEQALAQEQFVLFLQPKYHLSDESLAGAEALVRWLSGESGKLIYPGDFIPLFEKNGFITKLDMYMLERVCRLIKSWIDEGKEPVTVSINFSRLHLLNPDFTQEICTVSDRYRIPRKYIEIELTESAMFDNEEAMFSVLQSLHAEGFTLSMDDFGTGYSSLGLLKNLPVDVIKIDRSFFLNSRFKTRAKAVIENVMQMAKRLEIHTVAEGVESQEHIDMLREMGCDIVQGYYYSKPMPVEKFKLDGTGQPNRAAHIEPRVEPEELGDIALGRKEFGEVTSVYAYRLFHGSVRRALGDIYGEGEMLFALHNIGKLAGGMFAREMLDLSQPFPDLLLELSQKLSALQIGVLSVERIDLESCEAIVRVSGDLDCSGRNDCNQTLCQYDEGFFAGVMKEYTQRSYTVTETDCWGTGRHYCRFEIKAK